MSGIARFAPIVPLLVCCSCAKLQPLTDFGRNLTDYITGNTPIKGVTQSPMHGVSFAHTFDDADAPTRHHTQTHTTRSTSPASWRTARPGVRA